MINPLTVQYFDSEGRVLFMVCAAFALGLIVGALVMDWSNERARARRVRAVETREATARHRATP